MSRILTRISNVLKIIVDGARVLSMCDKAKGIHCETCEFTQEKLFELLDEVNKVAEIMENEK